MTTKYYAPLPGKQSRQPKYSGGSKKIAGGVECEYWQNQLGWGGFSKEQAV